MEKDSQISAGQLMAILLASRLAATLTTIPTVHQTSHSTDFMLSSVLEMLMLAVLFLPVWWFSRHTHGASTIDYSYILLGKGGAVVALLYALVSLYVQTESLMRFNNFVSTALTPDMPLLILCIALVVAAFLAALHGLQSLARAATLIAIAVVGAIVFVCVALIPEMEGACFPPVLYDGFSPVLAGALEELPRSLEIVTIGMLLPYVKGSVVKGYAGWTLLFTAAIVIVQVSVAGVLGDYGGIVLYPYYTAVTAARIGVLERVDIIATTVWLAALFIKMAFFAMLYMSCMQRIFGRDKKLIYAIVGAVLILLPGMLLDHTPLHPERAFFWIASTIVMGFFAIVLPLLLLLGDFIRNKRLKGDRRA